MSGKVARPCPRWGSGRISGQDARTGRAVVRPSRLLTQQARRLHHWREAACRVSWDTEKFDDFAKRLIQRIEATIGHGRYVAKERE